MIKGSKARLFSLAIPDDPKLSANFELRSLKRIASDDFINIHCNCLYAAGICVIETKMNIKKQITNVFESSNECVRISFFLEGISCLYNDVTKISTELSPGFVQLAYQCEFKINFDFIGKQQVRCVNIFMTRCYFLNLLKDEKWKNTDDFYAKVKQGEYVNMIQNVQLISTPMRVAIASLFEQRFDGILNNDYFQMKLREILLLYYIQQKLVAHYPVTMSEEVYTKLQKAKAYLLTNLSNYPTIKQLSRIVILNEMILKQGFKLLYGQPIYAYVFAERMKEAQRLLINGANNVNNVAEQVGYQSISHFIMVYKKYYGFTPKHTSQLMKDN